MEILNQQDYIENAVASFRTLLMEQLARTENMEKNAGSAKERKDCVKIGIVDGNGIGPIIVSAAEQVLSVLLKEELAKEEVVLERIEGLTIENRGLFHLRPETSPPRYALRAAPRPG